MFKGEGPPYFQLFTFYQQTGVDFSFRIWALKLHTTMGRSKKDSGENPEEERLVVPRFSSVDDVISLLDRMKNDLMASKQGKVDKLPELLLGLSSAVSTLVDNLRKVPKAAKERERILEDEVEELRQRSIKGNK